jgi:hypothetical protein
MIYSLNTQSLAQFVSRDDLAITEFVFALVFGAFATGKHNPRGILAENLAAHVAVFTVFLDLGSDPATTDIRQPGHRFPRFANLNIIVQDAEVHDTLAATVIRVLNQTTKSRDVRLNRVTRLLYREVLHDKGRTTLHLPVLGALTGAVPIMGTVVFGVLSVDSEFHNFSCSFSV